MNHLLCATGDGRDVQEEGDPLCEGHCVGRPEHGHAHLATRTPLLNNGSTVQLLEVPADARD